MKTKILKTVLFAGYIFFAENMHAQNVTIDYQAWNPTNPPCNLFSAATNVPATINGSSGTIQHQTKIGQPEYNTSNKSVELDCDYNNGNPTKGTKYRISYSFKKGYRYTITVSAAEWLNSSGTSLAPWLRLDLTNNGGGGNTACNGNQSIAQNLSGNPAPRQINWQYDFLNY